ncbi:MAG TPA: YiiX/YebB-like N1pC/P60 family cysteine hydrolase [Spirochaetota bacterium]|nr:YiiX/YebB-like N1pC/P60 family cysteine hydrolase [Spirochaetota bacterium]
MPEQQVLPVELNDNAYLIVRLGDGYFSNIFRRVSSEEKRFSHSGIIHRVGQRYKVYHIEANELTGKGIVRDEPLELFISHSKEWALYAINTSDSIKMEIVQQASIFFDSKIPFDLDFDLASDDKLYCSEMVAKSINNAFGEELITPGLHIAGRYFYGLDDIYLHHLFHCIYNSNDLISK